MKKLFLSFSVIISINSLFAQSVKKINIPEVKEFSIIDSILKKKISKALPGKSCILLDFSEGYNSYNLDVILIETNLQQINLYEHDLTKLSFFNYKGYIIFVAGPESLYHFFSKTRKSENFNFLLNKLSKGENRRINGNKNEIHLDVYEYQNGRFVTILIPLH
jgi:hypothetical protein